MDDIHPPVGVLDVVSWTGAGGRPAPKDSLPQVLAEAPTVAWAIICEQIEPIVLAHFRCTRLARRASTKIHGLGFDM